MSDDEDIRVRARQARKADRQQQESERKKRLGLQGTQSDQERIRIRQELRKLIDKTKKSKGAVTAGNQQLLKELHREHAELHDRVNYPSEANLDVEELSVLANITAEKTKRMAETFSAVSAEDYVAKLKSLFSTSISMDDDDDDDAAVSTNIAWTSLGMHPLNRFLAVRTVDFIPNVMEREIVAAKRKQIVRTVREVDTQAEQVQALSTTESLIKTQTESRVQLLARILAEFVDHPDFPMGIPLMQLVVNPEDFTQTVENLFDLSFLIGTGNASFTHDTETGEVYVNESEKPEERGKGNNKPPTQSIITMTYDLWKASIEAYNIVKSTIPHRNPLLLA